MKEDFLHHIWKFKLWETPQLKTVNGEEITIIKTGQHNTDAGPDFFNAQLKIEKNKWAGNVEVHVKSSDWMLHKHQLDKNYDNVILHVVYEHNQEIKDKNGAPIPTLELKGIINQLLINKYQDLIDSKNWIPCEHQLKTVEGFVVKNWLNRLAIERLERKSEEIAVTLLNNKNDWEATFYEYLFKYFGLKVNALPFQLLAKNTPLKIAEKHQSLLSVEALYFGQAGFLDEELSDEYFKSLKKEYHFLKAKFKLHSLDKSIWKYLRLRPSNFPTIRIAQLSSLLFQNSRFFSAILTANTISDIEKLFKVSTSSYWEEHYQFGKQGKTNSKKNIGKATIHNIIINVVVPILFVYAKNNNNETITRKALEFLELLPTESNVIVKKWNSLGVKASNALESQSLLELKNNYCSQKKCLTCNIGNNLLKK